MPLASTSTNDFSFSEANRYDRQEGLASEDVDSERRREKGIDHVEIEKSNVLMM